MCEIEVAGSSLFCCAQTQRPPRKLKMVGTTRSQVNFLNKFGKVGIAVSSRDKTKLPGRSIFHN